METRAWALVVLDTMGAHVVREEARVSVADLISVTPAAPHVRVSCSCGRVLRTRELGRNHQAQAVVDALQSAGWRPPSVLDGEIVTRAIGAGD